MTVEKRSYRRCRVYLADQYAGVLEETVVGYRFSYDKDYQWTGAPIGYQFPINQEQFEFTEFPPLFDNLVSEGWMRRTHSITQKISESDRFGLLLENGADLIGAITIERVLSDE